MSKTLTIAQEARAQLESWIEFEVDYFAEQEDGTCSDCGKTISCGMMNLDCGGEEVCFDCFEKMVRRQIRMVRADRKYARIAHKNRQRDEQARENFARACLGDIGVWPAISRR